MSFFKDTKSSSTNTALGTNALNALTSGSGNIALGPNAAASVTTATNIIAIGPSAGNAITITMDDVIAIGQNAAGAKTTSGNHTICIGKNAGSAITTAANSLLIGYNTGISITTNNRNTIIGHLSDATLDDNLIVGYGSYGSEVSTIIGHRINTLKNFDQYLLAIGYAVARNATNTGAGHILVGRYAGGSMSGTNGYNLFIGDQAGEYASGLVLTAGYNIGIGLSSGRNTAGKNNIYIGTQSGTQAGAPPGSRTIAIGYQAAQYSVLTVDDTIAIGYRAGRALTSGVDNILIGPNAGDAITTAANNIAIGRDALGVKTTTGNNNIAMGRNAGSALTTGANNILIGYNTGNGILTANGIIIIGNLSDLNTVYGVDTIIVGSVSYGPLFSVIIGSAVNVLKNLGGLTVAIGNGVASQCTNTGGSHTLVGTYAGYYMSGTHTHNVFIGIDSGRNASGLIGTAGYNIGIGRLAARYTGGKNNIYFGQQSGAQAGAPTGSRTIAIGYQSAQNSALTVNDTIAIGYRAGRALTTSASTISIGRLANQSLTTYATESIAIGTSTSTRGYQSIAMGSSAYASETPQSQVQTITTTNAAGITDGGYFWLFTATISYYFWYRKNPPNTAVDPNPPVPAGFPATKSSQLVVISSIATDIQVAQATQAVINAIVGVFSAPATVTNTITVTNTVPGYVGSSGNGAGLTFSFALTTTGSSSPKTIAIGSGSIARTGTITLDAFPEIPRLSGYANIAIGKGARAIGASIIAIGENAGGTDNATYNARYGQIIIGRNALSTTPIVAFGNGSGAVCIGINAMQNSTNAYGIVCIGANAMRYAVGVGSRSVAIGPNALENYCGNNCVAIGSNVSMSSNLVAGSTIIGSSATCGSADNVVAIGGYASGISTGAVALGYQTSVTSTTAVAIGGYATTSGTGTVVIGSGTSGGAGGTAAFCNAANSIAIGTNAKITNASATSSLAIGPSITISGAFSNSVALGNGATLLASNQIQLGNGSITSLRCQVALTVVSDERAKHHIEPCDIGLEFISRMQPKKFHLIADEPSKQTKRFGFIAQDVRDLIKETGHSDFGVLHYDQASDRYSMDYADLIAPTIKALQEMKHIIDVQQKTIDALVQRIAVLESK